jgi:hypothetical protein
VTDFPIVPRFPRAFPVRHVFEHYSAAALTAATVKHEWIVPFKCRILDVIADSGAAGSGGTSDIVDVNVNGTTIYTTQANRPTLLVGDTGMFTEAAEPEIYDLKAGDVLSYDIDQIATTGSTLFKLSIVVGLPS